jgi:hypothetical protein
VKRLWMSLSVVEGVTVQLELSHISGKIEIVDTFLMGTEVPVSLS